MRRENEIVAPKLEYQTPPSEPMKNAAPWWLWTLLMIVVLPFLVIIGKAVLFLILDFLVRHRVLTVG